MGSFIRVSWSCQPYIRHCSRRSFCGRSRWTPGYGTGHRLWAWWLLAEARWIPGGLSPLGDRETTPRCRQVSGPRTTLYCCPRTACVSSHCSSCWGTCCRTTSGHAGPQCMCLARSSAARAGPVAGARPPPGGLSSGTCGQSGRGYFPRPWQSSHCLPGWWWPWWEFDRCVHICRTGTRGWGEVAGDHMGQQVLSPQSSQDLL